ncbi:hypothetical protein [Primorskyibacter sp. 2E233]|uniref:hypothetical protein n=1 Tax=Primorskyibacter sp. 2E233 TaxID=3413431 RepID=UPI003BF005DB
MKNTLAPLLIALVTLGLPAAAQADCFVEYKAKQDSPLRLHYGILAIKGSCPLAPQAASTAQARLSAGGWVLLNVLGLSEQSPTAQMRSNAGDYYLRY